MPLLLVPEDDRSMIGLAVAGLARSVWLHRTGLAPFGVAVWAAVAGAWYHAHIKVWWPAVAAVSVVVAAGMVWLPERFTWWRRWPVLDRRAERAYAAACVLAGGGWLAAATAAGVWRRPLPLLLAALTLVCGVPWWAHHRRRAKVRVERAIDAWPDVAEAVGLAGSRITSAVVDRWGWTARLALPRGKTARHVIDAIPAIESGLAARPGAVRVEPDTSRADRAVLRVVETDPHAAPVPHPGIAPGGWSIMRPVPLGLAEDGTAVAVSLLRRNALVGGILGSGKSGVLNTILAALVACPDVVLWGIDLKGGMELGPWLRCLDRLATTPAQAVAMFADAVAELDARAAASAQRGQRLWIPTHTAPALVLVVDEYAELPEQAAPLADSAARRGRAVAVNLLAATQRPTQKAMGQGAVRSQMDVRICLRVRERRDTDLILGDGMFNQGWQATALDAAGKFLISSPEHKIARRNRAYLLTDNDVTKTVNANIGHRPSLAIRENTHHDTVNEQASEKQTTATIPQPRQSQENETGPEIVLWAALIDAPEEGISIGELVDITGMSRSWIYYRLQEHQQAGRARQTSRRGFWRAVAPDDDHSA